MKKNLFILLSVVLSLGIGLFMGINLNVMDHDAEKQPEETIVTDERAVEMYLEIGNVDYKYYNIADSNEEDITIIAYDQYGEVVNMASFDRSWIVNEYNKGL